MTRQPEVRAPQNNDRQSHNPARLDAVLRQWPGSDKYNRVGEVGRGAFATVYMVTSKFNGSPYAAKELDKRKFMKNGVLDQKVENEMKIMQQIEHVRSKPPTSMILRYTNMHAAKYRTVH